LFWYMKRGHRENDACREMSSLAANYFVGTCPHISTIIQY
jgi:hypothetical protein